MLAVDDRVVPVRPAGRRAHPFQTHRRFVGDELGLEPSPTLRSFDAAVLQHALDGSEFASVTARPAEHRFDARIAYATVADGRSLAWASAGEGPPLVVVPAWVSNIDDIAAGDDPRSGLVATLARGHRVILYDRFGTGLYGVLPSPTPPLGAEPGELFQVLDPPGLGPVPLSRRLAGWTGGGRGCGRAPRPRLPSGAARDLRQRARRLSPIATSPRQCWVWSGPTGASPSRPWRTCSCPAPRPSHSTDWPPSNAGRPAPARLRSCCGRCTSPTSPTLLKAIDVPALVLHYTEDRRHTVPGRPTVGGRPAVGRTGRPTRAPPPPVFGRCRTGRGHHRRVPRTTGDVASALVHASASMFARLRQHVLDRRDRG